MMWMMLSVLVFCMIAIAVLSNASEPNFNMILFFLGASGFFLLGPYSMSSGCLTLDIAGAKGAGSCTGIIDGMGYIGGAIAAFAAGFGTFTESFLGAAGALFGMTMLNAFVLTTLDTSVRLTRFITTELVGPVFKPMKNRYLSKRAVRIF